MAEKLLNLGDFYISLIDNIFQPASGAFHLHLYKYIVMHLLEISKRMNKKKSRMFSTCTSHYLLKKHKYNPYI